MTKSWDISKQKRVEEISREAKSSESSDTYIVSYWPKDVVAEIVPLIDNNALQIFLFDENDYEDGEFNDEKVTVEQFAIFEFIFVTTSLFTCIFHLQRCSTGMY